MTKLYHGSEAGAAEGWQVPGTQAKGATKIDVPTSPAELAAWLNDRRVTAEPNNLVPIGGAELEHAAAGAPCNTAADEPAIGNPNRCRICKSILSATIAGADASAISRDLEAIADWMIEAPTWALDRLTEICRDRAAELGQAGKREAN